MSLARLAIMGGSVLLAAGPVLAQSRLVPVVAKRPQPAPAAPQQQRLVPVAQPAPPAQQQPTEEVSPADREVQQLLTRLTQVSDALAKNAESPQSWQYQSQQADVLLQIAYRGQGAERDNWLKMAIESYASAAVQSPAADKTAWDRLGQLPGRITQYFPESKLHVYAALQTLRAEHTKELTTENMDKAKADESLRLKLLRFAQQYPNAPEATKAVQEAAKISESFGRTEEACAWHRALAERHAGTDTGREARAALRRLGGMAGQEIDLKLPHLYPTTEQPDQPVDLKDLRGQLVVVFFWASDSAGTAEGFEAMKRITDRYRSSGVEAVYVNLDADASTARLFLASRLTAGTHVTMKDGLKNPVAERFGLAALPEVFLVGRDGKLVLHSFAADKIEAALATYLPAAPARRR